MEISLDSMLGTAWHCCPTGVRYCPVATMEGYLPGQPASEARKTCITGTATLFLSLSQIAAGLARAASDCGATANIEALCAAPIAALVTPLSSFIAGGTMISAACAKCAAGLPKDFDRRLEVDFNNSRLLRTEDRNWEIGECVVDASSTAMAIGQLGLALNAAVKDCPPIGIGLKKDLTTAQCTVDIGTALFSFSRIILFLSLATEHCTIGKQPEAICVAGVANLAVASFATTFNGAAIYVNCVLGDEQTGITQGLFLPDCIRSDVLKSTIWTTRRLSTVPNLAEIRREMEAEQSQLPFKDRDHCAVHAKLRLPLDLIVSWSSKSFVFQSGPQLMIPPQ